MRRRLPLVGYLILACAVAFALAGVHAQVRSNSEARHDLAAQAARTDQLAQQLCRAYSRARVIGNRTVRQPLRRTAGTLADVLFAASKNPNNPAGLRRYYRRQSIEIAREARLVQPVAAIPCEFK